MTQAQALRQQADFSDNMMATLENIGQKIGLSSKTVEEASEMSRGMQSRMDDLSSRQHSNHDDNNTNDVNTTNTNT